MMPSPIHLVEASAGSGKTYRLTRAYLASLFERMSALGGGEAASRLALRSLLAITFTRKAAGEMVDRIREGLVSLAWNYPPGTQQPLINDLGVDHDASFLIHQAGVLVETLLRHLDDFQVRTIDSFMSAMVQVLSPELGLPPLMETVEDQKGTIRARLLRFLDLKARHHWGELEPVLGTLEAFAQIEGKAPEEVLLERLGHLFNRRMTKGGPGEGACAERDTLETLRTGLETWGQAVREYSRELGTCLQKLRDLPGSPARGNRLTPQRIEMLCGADTVLLRKLVAQWSEVSWLNPEKGVPLEELIKVAAQERADVQALLHQCRLERDRLWHALGILSEILSRQETAPYLLLLNDFGLFWEQDRDLLLIAEFPLLLGRWVQEWEEELAFPYLFFKMSERYRRILVDEFQDTSQSQFHILRPLAAEQLASQPEASFLAVGDRKQAIYRWRGGEAGLMDAAVLEGAFRASGAPFGVRVETLTGNWRSKEEIVSWNNGFWAAMHLHPAFDPDFSAQVAHQFKGATQVIPTPRANAARGGRVALSRVNTSGMRARDTWWPVFLDRMDAHLKDLVQAGYPRSDIAVLVRSNAEAQALMGDLLGRGWHFVSDQSFRLSSSQLVADLMAFLLWTHRPGDTLSLLTALLSPFFEPLWARGGDLQERSLLEDPWSWLEDQGRKGTGLRQAVLNTLPGAGEAWLKSWFRAADAAPAYDLLCDLTGLLDVESHQDWVGEIPFVLSLQEMFHRLEEEGISDLGGVLVRWQEMLDRPELMPQITPREEGGERVRLLTLHKSKGLEFPAVVMPVLPGGGSTAWDRDVLEAAPGDLRRVGRGMGSFHAGLHRLEVEEAQRTMMDDMNLLYVGMTRSRESLTLLVVGGERPSGRKEGDDGARPLSWERLLLEHPRWEDEKVMGSWPEKGVRGIRKSVDKDDGGGTVWTTRRLRTVQWRQRMLVYRHLEPRQTDPARNRGTEIHRLLALLDTPLDSMLMERVRSGWLRLGLDPAWWEHLADLLGETGKRHLFVPPPGMRIMNEYPQMEEGVDDDGIGRLVPDRLVLGLGRWMLVEYKTGRPEPTHQEQVRRYCDLLAGTYPGFSGEAWLLYLAPDGPGWVEVPC